MFNTMTYYQLQQYWWAIVSLLGALLVFLLFVQGGQTFIHSLAKNKDEKNLLINSLGRKWHFTFTTLVTFGGALFAAFPLLYATSFGGAYWLWMIILFCFIIQAVSYEYRKKSSNFLGTKTYDIFLFINGSVGVFLLGVAVSTFYDGGAFRISEYNLSRWENPWRGLEALCRLNNLLLGFSVFFLARISGLLYFINNINHEELYQRSLKKIKFNTLFFLVFFLSFLFIILFKEGYQYDPNSKIVSLVAGKYLNNLIVSPILLIIFLLGIIAVLVGIFSTLFTKTKKGIWFTGTGTIGTVFSLIFITGSNYTCIYPSHVNIQHSLTIENASSSYYTLMTMGYASLLIPFVFTYIFIAWKLMDKKKLTTKELDAEEHAY